MEKNITVTLKENAVVIILELLKQSDPNKLFVQGLIKDIVDQVNKQRSEQK